MPPHWEEEGLPLNGGRLYSIQDTNFACSESSGRTGKFVMTTVLLVTSKTDVKLHKSFTRLEGKEESKTEGVRAR